MESVDVDVAHTEFAASVQRPIPRRHVIATIALGIALILAVGLGKHGFSSPSQSGSAYTSVAGKLHQDEVPDSVAYLEMTDAHHGGPGSDMAPFTARWLVPAVAGLLPVDAGVALQLVNMALLVAGMACLVLLLSRWVRHSATLVVAVVLFSVAVPVLQSAGAIMVDAAAVGLASIGIWAAYRLPLWAALAVLAVGVMAKETVLILIAFGVALELIRGSGRRRWLRAAAWCVTGGVAYLIARSIGSSGRLVFVPWLPHDLHNLEMLLRVNLGRGDAWILTGLTIAVPTVSVLIAIWGTRRNWFHIAPSRLAPLAVGVGFAILLSIWSAVAAWWEPRSAWMAIPFGVPIAAFLVDIVLDRGIRSTLRDRRFRRVALATGALGIAGLVVAGVVTSALPFRAYQSHDTTPRLTATPIRAFDAVSHSGRGNTELKVPVTGDDRPVVLDVEVPHPTDVRVETAGATRPLFDGRLDTKGTFLVDRKALGGTVALKTDGPWTARFRSLDTVSRWSPLDALSGHGPNVVLIPGTSPFSIAALFSSSTKGSHFQLVGDCHVPDCPDERAGELPIGLEALAVNDPGDWSVVPERAHQEQDAVRLSDLR